MNHVVIGALGQIGTAIKTVLAGDAENIIFEVDKGTEWPREKMDVMHVAIPYDKKFVEIIKEYQDYMKPDITIIHATVPPGTSRKLGAVHSPVTGRHPNLTESVMTFIKAFGCDNVTKARYAAKVFEDCGVKTSIAPNAETTEAGKLWQTLQFGIQVALQKEGYKYFDKVGADPQFAYHFMNYIYNSGYEDMQEPWALPTLTNVPGPIGGHCIVPNAKITDNRIAKLLVNLNNGYVNDSSIRNTDSQQT